ncbi:MAG: FtsQ-type POTRA domain-containing protein [Verrucomicrobia bacterium]|jgi:cell division septal protein FtsQ|nr:FtsQ-type POTRA domain-containing protein [Verrucomicrobiota bacterium]
MFFKSSKSPFRPPTNPEDIGLGCQRRERRHRWVKRLSRIGGYLGTLVLLVWMLQGGIQMFLENFVWNNRSLSLQRFQVRSQGVIPQHLLIQWTGLSAGDNLLAFHLAEVKRNLELSPFVAEASVERVFPETLSIHVRERKPKARIRLLQLDGAPDGDLKILTLLLDEEGVVMSTPRHGEIPVALRLKWQQLPELKGASDIGYHVGRKVEDVRLKSALHWVTTFQQSIMNQSQKIVSVDISEKDLLKVQTQDGQNIHFAYGDVETQLAKWMQVIEFGRQIGRRLAFLDLSISNNMPFEWVPEEAMQADERHNRNQTPNLNHVDV